jgi:hypothetical protein
MSVSLRTARYVKSCVSPRITSASVCAVPGMHMYGRRLRVTRPVWRTRQRAPARRRRVRNASPRLFPSFSLPLVHDAHHAPAPRLRHPANTPVAVAIPSVLGAPRRGPPLQHEHILHVLFRAGPPCGHALSSIRDLRSQREECGPAARTCRARPESLSARALAARRPRAEERTAQARAPARAGELERVLGREQCG